MLLEVPLDQQDISDEMRRYPWLRTERDYSLRDEKAQLAPTSRTKANRGTINSIKDPLSAF
jgi:hypothetical protein